jgi:protein-tyrosine phosphatase
MLKKEGLPDIDVISRGLAAWPGQPLSEGTRTALQAVGLAPEPHQSRKLTADDVRQAHWIRVMTADQERRLLSDYPQARTVLRRLGTTDIQDPLGGSPQDYEKCRMTIQDSLLDLLIEVKSYRERTPS